MVRVALNIPKKGVPWVPSETRSYGKSNTYNAFLMAHVVGNPTKKFEIRLRAQWVAGGSFLCGTTACSDFMITGRWQGKEVASAMPKELTEPGPSSAVSWGVDEKGALVRRDADSTLKVKAQELAGYIQKQVWKQQKKLIKDLLPNFIDFMEAETTCVVLGGRVTPHHSDALDENGERWSIRSPELAKYLIENKVGVLTASHVHQNKNHVGNLRTDGTPDLSCYQYWVWTYQLPTTEVPRVTSTNPEYCGVFDAGVPEAGNVFKTFWADKLDLEKSDPLFEPRYKLKK